MPSAIRRMQLNEAFQSMDEAGEMKLLEIAQMLAERFPKRIEQQVVDSANDSVSAAGLMPLMVVGSSFVM